jgi:hypothetical protein
MRALLFLATLSFCNLMQAYVVNGARTGILVNGASKKEIKSIYFEGCDNEFCEKFESRSQCTWEASSKWNCQIKDEYPKYVRFVLTLNGNKILRSKFIFTNGDSVLDNFILTVNKNSLTAESTKSTI